MKTRTYALGSALAGLLIVAPAYAHTSQPATPEEMQQTEALNAQALVNAQGGTTTAVTPAAPMTTAAASPATDADNAAAMTPSTPAEAATPATTVAAATPLNSLPATQSLDNAAVQGSDGMAVGTVKDVVKGADGKPSIVDVALSDNSKVVAISASELSFDASRNMLVASLTQEQIKALPAANG
jgi:hypothetical protein